MGLPANIYRSSYNSSLNVLGSFGEVTIVNVPGPFDPSPSAPPVMLCPGNARGTVVIRPVSHFDADGKPVPIAGMMGGAYVSTSDSRFGAAVEKILGHTFYGAVPLHDRVEN